MSGYTQRWDRSAHLGQLWSLQSRGWWWCGTKDVAETAQVIQLFEAWARKEKHRSLDHRPGPKDSYGRASNRDFQRHLVMGIPTVGPELADRIIDTVGMPFGLVVDDDALLDVEGIGPKTLRKIKEAF